MFTYTQFDSLRGILILFVYGSSQEAYPDKVVKLFLVPQINNAWNKLERDRVALRNFILSQ